MENHLPSSVSFVSIFHSAKLKIILQPRWVVGASLAEDFTRHGLKGKGTLSGMKFKKSNWEEAIARTMTGM